MRVLVLGGTKFLGRHIVDAAVARGHQVSTFTRGHSGVRPPEGVEALHGDRDGDVTALRGKSWDLVVDTSAYHPKQIHSVAAALGTMKRYIFISTASVYRAFPEAGATERSATHRAMRDALAEPGPTTYGPLKVACEDAATRYFPEATVVLRPGVIIGPHDPTNRFTYWVQRAAEGGEMLAPGNPDHPVQLLDARDLADWIFRLPDSLGDSVFNLTGPATSLTMRDMLGSCISAQSSGARLTWVTDEFLLDHHIAPWSELPLWIPEGSGPQLRLNDAKARALGYRNRPLAETIADIARDTSVSNEPLGGGLPKAKPISRDRERELLAAWHRSMDRGTA